MAFRGRAAEGLLGGGERDAARIRRNLMRRSRAGYGARRGVHARRAAASVSSMRALRESAVVPRGGRGRGAINSMLAHKGRIVAGGVVAAGGLGAMTSRRSGLDRPMGRPTGPFVY